MRIQMLLHRTGCAWPDAFLQARCCPLCTHGASLCEVLSTQERMQYKESFQRLRGLKAEIEHLHLLLGQATARRERDFQLWLAAMRRQAGLPPRDAPAHSIASQSHSIAQPTTAPDLNDGRGTFMHDVHPDVGSSESVVDVGGSSATILAAPASHSSPQLSVDTPQSQTEHEMPGQSQLSAQSEQVERSRTKSHSAAEVKPQTGHNQGVDGAPGGSDQSQQAAEQAGPSEFAEVDPDILAAARPLFTGNTAADRDIVRFYTARSELLKSRVFQTVQT